MRSLCIEIVKYSINAGVIFYENKGYFTDALNTVKEMIDNYNRNLSKIDKKELACVLAILVLTMDNMSNEYDKYFPIMGKKSAYMLSNAKTTYIFDKSMCTTVAAGLAIEKTDIWNIKGKSDSIVTIDLDNNTVFLKKLTNIYNRNKYRMTHDMSKFVEANFSPAISFNQIEDLLNVGENYKGWKTKHNVYEIISEDMFKK